MRKIKVIGILLALMILMVQCQKSSTLPAEDYDDRLSGGLETVFNATSHAFSQMFTNMGIYDEHVHSVGDDVFSRSFVTAPAPINSGLGALYNNVSCISCHHNDGIGLPTAGESQSSLLVRISQPGTDANGGPLAVPGYGLQLQDKAIFGKLPECKVNISYTYTTATLDDGTPYELRTPTYTLSNLYTPIATNYMLSPRLAPPMIGLGLLEAIPESQIVAGADPSDANNDGIKGRANYVYDANTKTKMIGRFGWKANTATIITQIVTAFNQDMGLTTSILPVESSFGQPQYDGLKDDPEVADTIVNAVKFYAQTLCVPARRNTTDIAVKRGEQLFALGKCVNCHKQTFTTAVDVTRPYLSSQVIHPYTDMLVHDMGPGLADNRPDYLAGGQDWRTAPLWGLGLYETINSPGYYLHDGRARTLIEAIMWHGGEAESSKAYFSHLSTADRNAMLTFLKSL
ncbi:di-heme oxidoredictase family protein [Mucilaginibacter jinjuensis]|uniref:Di-heme oxidoredictase family protein n=1 Tax=Mucilaginibacter jinjuensis TaxID=1176721 RepID=A0ABY7T3Y3_9SPHI|nr:di-heme oxidoredictase family protein [Mucilaginibacter jinjuensis]WCT11086.1 di-heme oxidoredictase family protein [Mucilaginibacter jinjuensis]